MHAIPSRINKYTRVGSLVRTTSEKESHMQHTINHYRTKKNKKIKVGNLKRKEKKRNKQYKEMRKKKKPIYYGNEDHRVLEVPWTGAHTEVYPGEQERKKSDQ